MGKGTRTPPVKATALSLYFGFMQLWGFEEAILSTPAPSCDNRVCDEVKELIPFTKAMAEVGVCQSLPSKEECFDFV